MHDLVIRGGIVVDGTGKERFTADVAIDGDRIARIGDLTGVPARRELDARGLIVTPGWVDIHTHYDGQATWDAFLSPSCWHGVTTIVMGNCGVGFAPVRPDRHAWLISLMEGVEDIPGSALSEGIQWGWETFPEYLDSLGKRTWTVDVATQVPHGAVRAYVMGERGAKNGPASVEDIRAMAAIVKQALQAGALGFSTSRTLLHRATDGEPIPGTFASREELLAIGQAMSEAGHGVFELASDMTPAEEEFDWIIQISAENSVPITYALVQQRHDPDAWRRQLKLTDLARSRGADVSAQISSRATGMILGWESSKHAFMAKPTYWTVAGLPFEERIAKLRDPEVKQRILAEPMPELNDIAGLVTRGYDHMFKLPQVGSPNYEPSRTESLESLAASSGVNPESLLYDAFMENEGRGKIYLPILNYADFNLDHVLEMFRHPKTVIGLSDGGAHCGFICDASSPTFLLAYWARDRSRGEQIPLEEAVSMQTSRTAQLYGLNDRGVLAPGMKADVNVIDFDRLQLSAPEMVYDLPAGAGRLVQRAIGYRATIVSGRVTFEDGEHTGELPGRLVRGPQNVMANGELRHTQLQD